MTDKKQKFLPEHFFMVITVISALFSVFSLQRQEEDVWTQLYQAVEMISLWIFLIIFHMCVNRLRFTLRATRMFPSAYLFYVLSIQYHIAG